MNRFQQQGIGLVELMLAILISSFLLIGITEIFSGNKRTYNYQQVQGMSNENKRISSVLLTNLLHQIGHLPITNESLRGKHEVFRQQAPFAMGESLSGTAVVDAGNQRDTLTYRYFSGDGIITCAGQDFGLNFLSPGKLEFRERTETLSVDDNGHLICTGVTRIGSEDAVKESVVLMGDAFVDPFQKIEVQQLSFTYGIDSDNDESVDVYAVADKIGDIEITNSTGNTDDTAWERVKLIKVAIVVQSGFRDPETTEYMVFLENLSEIQQ